MTDFLPVSPGSAGPADTTRHAATLRAARKLEATFLAEMLKSAGFGAQVRAFGGGVGEEQFASFQRLAIAEEMVESGGIGLADAYYHSLMDANMENRHDT